MLVSVDAKMKKVFPPEMLALLKGKSCFHIQRIDATVMAQIEKALKVGFDCYRNKGWV